MDKVPKLYRDAVEEYMSVNGDTEGDVMYFWLDNVHRWELTTDRWCYSPMIADGEYWVRAISRLN